MQIRTKLLLLLAIMSVLLLSILIINIYLNKSSYNLYVSTQIERLKQTANSSLNVNNELLNSTTNDYTYWDELVSFTLHTDTVFAENYLTPLIGYPHIDYLWIYNIMAENIFTRNKEDVNYVENSLNPYLLYSILDTNENSDKRFTNFYFRTDSFVIVVSGGTIHTTDDVNRLQKPNGFFLLGKLIDDSYLKKLSILTNSNVLLLFDSTEYKNQNENSVYTISNLYNCENKYVATLVFEKQDNFLSENKSNQKKILLIFFVIIIVSIIIILIIFNNIFTKPFNLIILSLNNNKINFVENLLKQKNEFGIISRLIESFFNQKTILESEVEERKQIMIKLEDVNTELKMQNEEIRALNDDISSANEELRQQNEEITALNDDISSKNAEIQEQNFILLENEEKLLKLTIAVEQSENVVIITNLNGIIEYTNKKFTELTGYLKEEALGKDLSMLKSGFHSKEYYNNLWETIKKGETWRGEFFNKKKNSDTFWDNTTITPVKNSKAEIVSYIAIKEDITEKKKAEEELRKSKRIIEIKNRNILDSIQYAARIQNALLPPVTFMNMLLPNHFTLFIPKDIVSGDFYLIKQIRNFTLLAVGDCTGHGVPGAFMSMLGISLLNEILFKSDINAPDIALNELRNNIKIALQQTGNYNEQKDGLDLALCVIDLYNNELSFAGANIPLWLFRKNTDMSDFFELPADHQPVGVHYKEKPFTEHKMQLQEDDVIYLFSDGYISQFGGENNRKYQKKNLKNTLSIICNLPMPEQKQILIQNFNDWKKIQEQTDDVLVIGVKI